MPEPKHPDHRRNDGTTLSCSEFRARHAEYVDEALSEEEAARLGAHARTCLPCARRDRAVRRACELVRALPAMHASDEFAPRLQHRIFHVRDDERFARRSSGGQVAVSLTLACVMAALAWSPLLQEGAEPVELAPVQARAPRLHEPALARTGGLRVNLFSSETALPGVWLNGRPAAPPFGSRTLRGPALSDAEAYPTFLLDPALPRAASPAAADGAASRD